jgi:GT2 family glycosyltransferase
MRPSTLGQFVEDVEERVRYRRAMNRGPRIAALLTCFNRREMTLACLRTLYAQSALAHVEVSTYLVDDGCSDGTGEAVRHEFPQVNVLRGDGSLYWCGGMRFAWTEAFKGGYDGFLWLNDDTALDATALDRLLETAAVVRRREGKDAIVVGSTLNPETGELAYGGVRKVERVFLRFELIEPGPDPVRCDTICGNCVFVPASVAERVGNLSSSFAHYGGDFDYALRAAELGFSSWIAPGFIGTCGVHHLEGSYLDASVPLDDRLRMLARPSGPPPPREYMVFLKRHAGWRWVLQWAPTLLRAWSPRLWLWLRSRRVSPGRARSERVG